VLIHLLLALARVCISRAGGRQRRSFRSLCHSFIHLRLFIYALICDRILCFDSRSAHFNWILSASLGQTFARVFLFCVWRGRGRWVLHDPAAIEPGLRLLGLLVLDAGAFLLGRTRVRLYNCAGFRGGHGGAAVAAGRCALAIFGGKHGRCPRSLSFRSCSPLRLPLWNWAPG